MGRGARAAAHVLYRCCAGDPGVGRLGVNDEWVLAVLRPCQWHLYRSQQCGGGGGCTLNPRAGCDPLGLGMTAL